MNDLKRSPAVLPATTPDFLPRAGIPAAEIYLIDVDTWKVTDASEGACRNAQYSAAEIRAKQLQDICPTCTPAFMQQMLDSRNADGQMPITYKTSYHRKDGSCYCASVSLERLAQPNVLLLITVLPAHEQQDQMEKAPREAGERMMSAIRAAGLGIREWNLETHDFRNCPTVRKLLGIRDDVPIHTLDDFMAHIHPDDHALIQQTTRQCLTDGEMRRIEYRALWPAGGQRWLAERCQAVADPYGKYVRMLGVMADITEQKNAEVALKASEQWLTRMLDHISDGIITLNDQGRIETFNSAATALFGYRPDEAVGQHISLLIQLPPGDRDARHLHSDLAVRRPPLPGTGRHETQGRRKDGTRFPMELTASEMRQDNRQLIIAIIRDITERKETALRMEYLAHYDSLTTLPNRALFMKRLEAAVSQAQRTGRPAALMFLDLDRFKEINDSLGHQAGDQMLMEVARRLKNCLRAPDVVARLGGDEFTVLMEGVSKPKHAAAVARKILDCFNAPILLCGRSFDVTASIGIALCPLDAANSQEMLKAADVAMYAAKNRGRNNYQFYQPTPPDLAPPSPPSSAARSE